MPSRQSSGWIWGSSPKNFYWVETSLWCKWLEKSFWDTWWPWKRKFLQNKIWDCSRKRPIKSCNCITQKTDKILETEIITIKESDTFKTIISIEDWDDYFQRTKERLQRELEELQLEIEAWHYDDIKKNSTYPKVAIQWLNQALCFYQSLCLVDSAVLRYCHLRVAANR